MKTKILAVILIIIGSILMGYSFFFQTRIKKTGKELETIAQLQYKLDSLANVQVQADTVIKKIYVTKLKLKIKYETDTIYINKLPMDSLKLLFLREYPRE
jgi:hypothetical protein